MTRVRVGTSGWQYADWRPSIYPKGLGQSRWLARYAELFDTVEVNGTFYRLPTEATVERWAETTPDEFCFAVKASRYLTHIRRLAEPRDPVELFLRARPSPRHQARPGAAPAPAALPRRSRAARRDARRPRCRPPGVRGGSGRPLARRARVRRARRSRRRVVLVGPARDARAARAHDRLVLPAHARGPRRSGAVVRPSRPDHVVRAHRVGRTASEPAGGCTSTTTLVPRLHGTRPSSGAPLVSWGSRHDDGDVRPDPRRRDVGRLLGPPRSSPPPSGARDRPARTRRQAGRPHGADRRRLRRARSSPTSTLPASGT